MPPPLCGHKKSDWASRPPSPAQRHHTPHRQLTRRRASEAITAAHPADTQAWIREGSVASPPTRPSYAYAANHPHAAARCHREGHGGIPAEAAAAPKPPMRAFNEGHWVGWQDGMGAEETQAPRPVDSRAAERGHFVSRSGAMDPRSRGIRLSPLGGASQLGERPLSCVEMMCDRRISNYAAA